MDRSFRLARETKALLALRRAGVPVPEILAWGVEWSGLLPVRTLLLEQRIPGAEDLDAFIRRERAEAARRRVLGAVGDAVRQLHDAGLFHGDLATRNVLVRPEPSGVDVWFIDCPRAKLHVARWRHDYLARRDRALLSHHMTRAGAARDEVRMLLEACGEEHLDVATQYAENRERERRNPRSQLWLWSGR
jgi:3-deoxy-D-manno-octulosonic acid kinase